MFDPTDFRSVDLENQRLAANAVNSAGNMMIWLVADVGADPAFRELRAVMSEVDELQLAASTLFQAMPHVVASCPSMPAIQRRTTCMLLAAAFAKAAEELK